MPQFRTKARAVELLGKNQIADLPTAICELWKNGYDAYADNLRCDLYKPGYEGVEEPIFTLSDDGCGMSYTDLMDKWIVLGTDSKKNKEIDEKDRFGKERRVPLGEKGIGRLSVAYLGAHMLLLTKKADEQLQALFFNWDILQNQHLYLEDIEIPVKPLEDPLNIQRIYQELINEYKLNLTKKKENWKDYEGLKSELNKQLLKYQYFPAFLKDEIVKRFGQKAESKGTMFIVFNPIDELTELEFNLKTDEQTRKNSNYNYLRTSLLGLFNIFDGKKSNNPILTQPAFYLNNKDGTYDFLNNQEFFRNDDINSCEFQIEGSFDEYGMFRGLVKAYEKEFEYQHKPLKKKNATEYGPFTLKIGFNEGVKRNTTLSSEQWDELDKKFKLYGGLYLYRDNFRVLPYGRSQYDFLKFEERRSMNAGKYMISHRNMIGFIDIEKALNPMLKDKAGREGLINNKAYKTFVEDLIDFFVQLANSQLNRYSGNRQDHLDKVNEKRRTEELLKDDKKRERSELKEFRKKIKTNHSSLSEVEIRLNSFANKLSSIKSKSSPAYKDIIALIKELSSIKAKLKRLKVTEPTRVSLKDVDKNALYHYSDKYYNLHDREFELAISLKDITPRKILIEKYHNNIKEYREQIQTKITESEKRISEVFEKFKEDIGRYKGDYLQRFDEECLSDISHLEIEDEEVELKLRDMEKNADKIIEEVDKEVVNVIDYIEKLGFDSNEEELLGLYKKQYEEFKKKVEAMHELAQLGMAIEIIDHQFNVLYAQMTESILFFRDFVKGNSKAEKSYRQLRTSFEHLETNHRLLTPLYRTMRRGKSDISGEMIKDYLNKFFQKVFDKEAISFTVTESFKNYNFYSYQSVIYPVFINIINNAVYWLVRKESKEIVLDYIEKDKKLLIINSGEKMEYTELSNAFELFFSKRPEGRGIGLYLARTNLRQVGYDIYATNEEKYNRLEGACFIIEKYQGE